MLAEGKSGPVVITDGSQNQIRLAKDSSLVVQDGHATYNEPVYRGNVYLISTAAAGVTLAAANASLTAATAQPIVGLYNPANSGVIAVILEAMYGPQAAGVAAANEGIGVYQFTGAGTVTTQTGTAPLSIKNLVNSGSRMVGLLNQPLTGNTITWVQMKPVPCSGTRMTAPTASINVNAVAKDRQDGLIQIPPGCAFGIFVLAAGTTITSAASLTWEEIPV